MDFPGTLNCIVDSCHHLKVHPRVIPLWGLVAVVLALGGAAFQIFGYAVPLWVSLPVAPFELAIGFWLLFRGIKEEPETLRPVDGTSMPVVRIAPEKV